MRWMVLAVLAGSMTGCAGLYQKHMAEIEADNAAEEAARKAEAAEEARLYAEEHKAEIEAETRAQADRDAAYAADLQWRAEHPTEARYLDALRGIEAAIREGNRQPARRTSTHCTTSTHLGQTYTNCY